MMALIQKIDLMQMLLALQETLFMTFFSLLVSCIIGLFISILLLITSSGGLFENKIINQAVDFIVNLFRAIPFIILMFLLLPLTQLLVHTMLGAKAALPSLIVAASPFFARMCVIAFTEVDKGTVEASKAMGATPWQIITKVYLPEAMPAIVSAISVCGISLVSYTAMAGAIGAGGLGQLAYLYGLVRRNNPTLVLATVLILVIVFIIQGIGDKVSKKIDKR